MRYQPGREHTGLEIAIVGMAGRFPGASNIEFFWQNILDRVESVTRYADDELKALGVPQELLADPDYVKAGVPFEGKDAFDADFFGYTPRDAEQIDPQHRLFLECAWSALEHAGYDPQRYPGEIGVYAGTGANVYLMKYLLPRHALEGRTDIANLLGLMSGNMADALATRVAYKLNLRGPAVTVQTACSTSLMAVHTASQALLGHECDMALAGGVSLNLLNDGGYRYQAGAILSPDGHCRAFDAKAAGTLLGSGVGIVVLKRLGDALQDGDTIHAIIKGSAANNDGSDKVGFTAPSIGGQAAVIRGAQAMAAASAETIGYIEAHGTGTSLGDPIEIAALTQAFRASTDRRGYCAIGSVKTNIGHLDAAAGVAGLIKTVLALRQRTLPPSLNFDAPNPRIDFDSSPFYVNTAAKPWVAAGAVRRAGVSSFGIGGTNVHVVLEEAPPLIAASEPGRTEPGAAPQMLLLAARSAAALDAAGKELASHLDRHPDQSLDDVAHTLRVGRRRFGHRAAVLGRDRSEVIHALAGRDPATYVRGEMLSERPSVAFLFPGQGAQHADMGRELYQAEPIFRETVDHCSELLHSHVDLDLRQLLFPAEAGRTGAGDRLAQTAITQPALFVIEYALAQWWMHQGVRPDAMLGHSIGEYVAACLAGVFNLEDALGIVAARGRLLQATERGAMLAVSLAESQLQDYRRAGCDLAAVNGSDLCVLSGATAAIERAERDLARHGVAVRRLHVSHGFHSALVEPMLDEFKALLSRLTLSAPRIPFVSNLSGRWITVEEARDPDYWVRHVRGAVRFADGLDELLGKADRVLLEVGPGETLSILARRRPLASGRPVLASQCHPNRAAQNADQPGRCMAHLWVAGVEPEARDDSGAVPRQRVALPTYPFERKSYWAHSPAVAGGGATGVSVPAARGIADWFHVPSWKRVPAPAESAKDIEARGGVMLLFGGPNPLTDRLDQAFQAKGRTVVRVEPGREFAQRDARGYAVRPADRGDLERLLRCVEAEVGPPSEVCHAWNVDFGPASARSDDLLERGFFSLLALAQVLGAAGARRVALTVVASQLEDVSGTEPLCPEKAALHGPCKVMPLEYPHLACRVIDVLPADDADALYRLVRQIVAEVDGGDGETLVAYRGPHRWVRTFARLHPKRGGENPASGELRKHGVYLITGGLGGIGLALARHLARQWQARLVLLGRGSSPEKAEAVAELEALGAEVLVLQSDVADAAQMRSAIDTAQRRYGVLHGIVHAAGVAGGGVIGLRERGAVEQVFAPKIQGTKGLMKAIEGMELDFVLLCSSLTAVAGGFGQVDYCAANSFLDAVATEASRRGAIPVLSVNWDVWRGVGMAAGHKLADGVGIDPDQAGVLLHGLLHRPRSPQVLVSTLDLEQQFTQLRSTGIADRLLSEPPAKRRSQPRPALRTAYAQPSG
ncbi:type I polyketide synthase [Achromobacter aegrifaciens]